MSNSRKRELAIGGIVVLLLLAGLFGPGSSSKPAGQHVTITVTGEWCTFGAGNQVKCSAPLAELELGPHSHVTIVAEAGSAGTVEDLIARLVAAGHTVTVSDDGGDA